MLLPTDIMFKYKRLYKKREYLSLYLNVTRQEAKDKQQDFAMRS